jgi:hypothetical protein
VFSFTGVLHEAMQAARLQMTGGRTKYHNLVNKHSRFLPPQKKQQQTNKQTNKQKTDSVMK